MRKGDVEKVVVEDADGECATERRQQPEEHFPFGRLDPTTPGTQSGQSDDHHHDEEDRQTDQPDALAD